MIKGASLFMEEKTLKRVLKQVLLTIWKIITLNPFLALCTRIKSEWIRDPVEKMKPS